MDPLILAVEECNAADVTVCAPANVNELFELPVRIGQINRTVLLIFLAAFIVMALLFMFILVGNLFEITPLVNFPITSRMAIPGFLALVTWVIFVIAGIRKQGLAYFGHLLWPPGVPTALKPLVGAIELVSTLLVRPFSLAVRLFANLVAGHVMLTLLLVSGVVFVAAIPDIGGKGFFGFAWFALGIAIYLFELLVAVLQAYIFTLLSAVYIQTSLHPEH